MTERIWIAGWELQCCGDPFAVGDEVRWRLSPADDQEWLVDLLGAGNTPVAALYDHHASDDVADVPAMVLGIEAVFCSFQQHGRTLTPIAGSATREKRATANGWEPESDPARFVGYLVEVERT